jgi:hypothetical protein
MSPPTLAAASAPSAGASETCRGDDNCNSILQSIAVMRSLLLDTSSSNLIGRNFPSTPFQQQQQQQPLDDQINVTAQNSSGTTGNLRDKLNDEISRRKTLESAYDSIVKLQKQQSNQLDIVIKSRQELDDQLVKIKANRKVEQLTQSQELMHLRQEIASLRLENKDLHQSLSQKTTQLERIIHGEGHFQSTNQEWKDRLALLQQQLESCQERAETAEKARELAQDEVRSTLKKTWSFK